MFEVRIRLATESDANDWNLFLDKTDQASFFHRYEWSFVLQDLGLTPYMLAAWEGDLIVGILPLCHVKSVVFGNHLSSLPFCAVAGPIAETCKIVQELVDEAIRICEVLKCSNLELRNREKLKGDLFVKSLYCYFQRPIYCSDEENLLAIPRKQRAVVRKAVKMGLTSETSDQLSTFYSIFAESVRNLGTPVFPKSFFKSILKYFADDVDILIVRDSGGLPIAAVMSFYFNETVMPYYGGSKPISRSLKGGDFMYWQLMCRATEKGMRTFDFGRSKRGTGPFSFKKNWGFEPTPLFYQYHLNTARSVPELNPNNPKFKLLIATWKRLPLPIANLIGPKVSKYLA